MSDVYHDAKIECNDGAVVIRGYYFPWGGAKTVPYSSIKDLKRVDLGLARGRARIWGTANPSLWANFDPGRLKKTTGFVIELGKRVQPFVTPDDPNEFERVVRQRANLGPRSSPPERGPII